MKVVRKLRGTVFMMDQKLSAQKSLSGYHTPKIPNLNPKTQPSTLKHKPSTFNPQPSTLKCPACAGGPIGVLDPQTPFMIKNSGSVKYTTHLDHISHCKTASGTNWSNRLTYRVFIKNTRHDKLGRVYRGTITPNPES